MNNISVERRGRVLDIALDRPPVNAFSYGLYGELSDALDLAFEPEVSVVIYRGLGKGFCAGADLNDFLKLTPETRRSRHEMVSTVFKKLYDVPVPVICQIHGFAVGAGVAQAALCDVRFASRETIVSMPEIDRGTVGGGGAFFNRLGMRPGHIREMLLTGRRFSAAEALEIGLLDKVVDFTDLDQAVKDLVDIIAAKSPDAIRAMKRGLNTTEGIPSWHEGYLATHPLSSQLARSPQTREGILSFLEKRVPEYGG